MKKQKLCVLFSFLFLTCCKTPPPDVSPCLMQGPGLAAIAKICNDGMKILGDPACTIDVRSMIAHCSPVLPTSTKKKVDIAIYQMDKFTAFSNGDYGALQHWILDEEQ